MTSNGDNENPPPPPPPPPPAEAQEEDAPLGFEDAVEQQPDLDEENRRRFPQIPPLAFRPWEGIEQDQPDEDVEERHEMVVYDGGGGDGDQNHEHEQLHRLQEQIRNMQRHLLFDLNNRGENLQDMNDDDDDDDDDENEWEDEEVASSNDGDNNQDTGGKVTYDRLLPTTHSYMNVDNFQEFSGVCLLADDRRLLLHIVELANMILIPNQIVPWQVFNLRTARMIKEAKQEQRLFGVIDACSSLSTPHPKYGTTAEIVSYHEDTNDDSLQLKIIGRQRFVIDDPSTMKRDLNGILRAHVRILPDLLLRRPPMPMLSRNYIHTINFALKYDFFLQKIKRDNTKSTNDAEQPMGCGQGLLNLLKRRRTTSSNSQDAKTPICSPNRNHLFRMRTRGSPWSLTPYPYWVMRRYDDAFVMSLIKLELSSTKLASDDGSLPLTPERFADWLLINIPFEIQTVQKILSFTTTIQRLRFVLSWLKRYKKFACRHCAADICEDQDIFSMSATGLMAAYVNPHGQIHETLTVLQVKNVRLLGGEVAEHSWFPGYKWTICQCRSCGNHLGWRFRNPSLKPSTFYGLTRTGLIFAKDTRDGDENEEQTIETHHSTDDDDD